MREAREFDEMPSPSHAEWRGAAAPKFRQKFPKKYEKSRKIKISRFFSELLRVEKIDPLLDPVHICVH
jgi:hypothetical protein